MIAIVSGSRDQIEARANEAMIFAALDEINPDGIIVGSIVGVDGKARAWARKRVKPCALVDAYWEIGTKAGPIRNRWMPMFGADSLILFPGGRGTADMHIAFLELDKRVYHVSPTGEITSNART